MWWWLKVEVSLVNTGWERWDSSTRRRESSGMCVQRSYWCVWAHILEIQEASFKYNYFTVRVIILWNRNFGDGLSLIGHSPEQSVLVHPMVRGHAGRSLGVPSTLNVLWFSLLNCLSWCDSGPFNCWMFINFHWCEPEKEVGKRIHMKSVCNARALLDQLQILQALSAKQVYSCSCITSHLVLVTISLQTTLLQLPTADAAQQIC